MRCWLRTSETLLLQASSSFKSISHMRRSLITPSSPLVSLVVSYIRLHQILIVGPVLHPALRVKWFKKLGEPLNTQAEVIFKHVFEEYTASMPPDTTPPSAAALNGDRAKGDGFLEEVFSDDEVHGASSGVSGATASDAYAVKSELDRYLSGEGGAGTLRDPLAWWKVSPPTATLI